MEVVALEAAHLGRPHAGPMHEAQPGGGPGAWGEVFEDGVDVGAVDPTGLR